MHKIVHLDLKGAPLKLTYLEKVFKCAKSWGATGVLLEWEDTFPYNGDLLDIGSFNSCGGDGMYSMEEVRYILQSAKQNGLEPIQLIQTIGHMEFVLKHPAFRDLREAKPKSPAVICPSKPQSQSLVCAMLQQALVVQSDAKYFHIGADEVWHTAVCEQCQRRAVSNKHKVPSLYLDHIRDVVLFLKRQRPDLIILMWDDMLRSMTVETLEHYKLGELIQPVVWNYNVKECFQIEPHLWDNYRRLFPNVWAGSAFKGANGSCQVLSPVGRYVSNQEAWLREMKANCNRINFVGVILTGWSRYDHYSTLCELFPTSMPSLASCLKVWANMNDFNTDVVSDVLPEEEWPGIELARCVHSFVMLRERSYNLIHGDLMSTWLNPWQIEHSYTNPVQVESIAVTSQALLIDLNGLQEEFLKYFHTFTGRRSKEEWMGSFFAPLIKRVSEIHEIATRRTNTDASVRPL